MVPSRNQAPARNDRKAPVHVQRQVLVMFALMIASLLVLLAFQNVGAQADDIDRIDGNHCIGVGPLALADTDFCGCTWGEVYYRGQPVVGAQVSLTFSEVSTETVALKHDRAEPPFYVLIGEPLGAKRGNIMTVRAEFAGETVERTFRAWPDEEGEQSVMLALPERGAWTAGVDVAQTHAMAALGDRVWALGAGGLLAVERKSGATSTHPLPWDDADPAEMTLAAGASLWLAGSDGLAQQTDTGWRTLKIPYAGQPSALWVAADDGKVLMALAHDGKHRVVAYNGGWRELYSASAKVTGLAVDDGGGVWVATWGAGVVRVLNGAATRHRIGDGLASDYLYAIAAGAGAVWVGGRPGLGADRALGGASRFDLAAGAWRAHGLENGLPADEGLTTAPAAVYDLAQDDDGRMWAATARGVYLLATEDYWVADGPTDSVVDAVAVTGDVVAAGTQQKIHLLDRSQQAGTPPTVAIRSAPASVSSSAMLRLSAAASDGDEAEKGAIVAWEWASDRDGPLCTTAETCEFPARQLASGKHAVSVRVLDDEGMWSEKATASVTIADIEYLPWIAR